MTALNGWRVSPSRIHGVGRGWNSAGRKTSELPDGKELKSKGLERERRRIVQELKKIVIKKKKYLHTKSTVAKGKRGLVWVKAPRIWSCEVGKEKYKHRGE